MGLFQRNGKSGVNGEGGGLRERIFERVSRYYPYAIKQALPYLQEAGKSREGRAKLVEKVKEIAYEQAD